MKLDDEKMNIWLDFDGHYEKHECDLMLKDGTLVECCWPNGGEFHKLGTPVFGYKGIFKPNEISKIKYVDYFSKLKELKKKSLTNP
jgi:hypothetical protein